MKLNKYSVLNIDLNNIVIRVNGLMIFFWFFYDLICVRMDKNEYSWG